MKATIAVNLMRIGGGVGKSGVKKTAVVVNLKAGFVVAVICPPKGNIGLSLFGARGKINRTSQAGRSGRGSFRPRAPSFTIIGAGLANTGAGGATAIRATNRGGGRRESGSGSGGGGGSFVVNGTPPTIGKAITPLAATINGMNPGTVSMTTFARELVRRGSHVATNIAIVNPITGTRPTITFIVNPQGIMMSAVNRRPTNRTSRWCFCAARHPTTTAARRWFSGKIRLGGKRPN